MFPCPPSIHSHPAVGRPTPLGPEGDAGYQLAILSGAECMDLLVSNMSGIRPQPTSSLVLRSWPRCHHKICLLQNPSIGILYKGALHLVFAFTVWVFDDPLHTSSAQAGSKSCKKQDYHSENVEKFNVRLVAGVAVQICLSKQTQKIILDILDHLTPFFIAIRRFTEFVFQLRFAIGLNPSLGPNI